MARQTDYVVLCEDKAQYTFARRFLIGRGAHGRKFSPKYAPCGRGAGEQWVRDQFAPEVRKVRRHGAGRALVVVIDADLASVDERARSLHARLSEAGLDPIRRDERIGLFVPRRNIETWILYILDPARSGLSEEADYKRRVPGEGWAGDVQRYAQQRAPKDDATPESLRLACRDWERIAP